MKHFPAPSEYLNLWDTLFISPELETPASANVEKMRLGPAHTRGTRTTEQQLRRRPPRQCRVWLDEPGP